ncbi:hypothetical protein BGLA2_310023 [Burkholderia gladioli]|nr:hypothetical protein BGLA2_310023 [Burkholderia gladioli]
MARKHGKRDLPCRFQSSIGYCGSVDFRAMSSASGSAARHGLGEISDPSWPADRPLAAWADVIHGLSMDAPFASDLPSIRRLDLSVDS